MLFEQVFVDTARLTSTVRRALQSRDQVSLLDIVREAPIELGLAEVVAYLALKDEGFDIVFDETVQTDLSWTVADGEVRTARVPASATPARAVRACVRRFLGDRDAPYS